MERRRDREIREREKRRVKGFTPTDEDAESPGGLSPGHFLHRVTAMADSTGLLLGLLKRRRYQTLHKREPGTDSYSKQARTSQI